MCASLSKWSPKMLADLGQTLAYFLASQAEQATKAIWRLGI